MVLFFQVITLNVAINSFSNALLTLLVSNQFVEIKSAVFKKFERENLFQLACAGTTPFLCLLKDVLERFQLAIYLLMIAFRNLMEVRETVDVRYVIDGLLVPVGWVFFSELAVDWLKHSFITKFNHIGPEVYEKYMDTLSQDFDPAGQVLDSPNADQSPIVSRRIGFSSLPLACLVARILYQTVSKTQVALLPLRYYLLAVTIMYAHP